MALHGNLYRDTVVANDYGRAVIFGGASVRFYLQDGQAPPVPYPGLLYPGPDDPTPITLPYVTGANGEIEVWADAPVRLRMEVSAPGRATAVEVIDLEPDPGQQASAADVAAAIEAHEGKSDPHPQYVTEEEGDEMWLPVSYVPPPTDLSGYYTEAEAEARFLDQGEADLRYLQIIDLPPPVDAYTKTESDARYLPITYTPPPVDLSGYQQTSQKGQPSGYAPLDPSSLIPTQYLPPLAITDTFVAASEAAMLALTAERGDVCIRTDTSKTYILAADPASVLANWTELASAGGVTSVDGKTGVVSLAADYVNVTGDTMTGVLTLLPASGNAEVSARGGASYEHGLVVRNSIGRSIWRVGTVANADQSFAVRRYNKDTQAYLGTALEFSQQAAGATMEGPLTLGGKPVAVSPDADNAFEWRANGFYATGGGGAGGGITQADADLRYVNVTGDTMTGQLAVELASGWGVQARQSGDTQARVALNVGGQVEWGSGSLGTDTFLSRSGTATLSLQGSLNPNVTNFRDLGTTSLRWRKLWATDAEFTNTPTVGGVPIGGMSQATADGLYVNVTGDTMTGLLTLSPASGDALVATMPIRIDGPTGTTRTLNFDSSGVRRWSFSQTSGDEFGFYAHDDAGNYKSPPALFFIRGTLEATFGGSLTTTAGLYVGGVDCGLVKGGTSDIRVNASLSPTTTNARDLGTTSLRWRKVWAVDGEFTNVPTIGGQSLDARYVNVSGDTMTGNLQVNANAGVGVTPSAWHSNTRAFQVGQSGAIWGINSVNGLYHSGNTYYDSGGIRRAIATGSGIEMVFGQPQEPAPFMLKTAPSVAAGAAQTFTERLRMTEAGALSLTGTLAVDGSGAQVRFGNREGGLGYLWYTSNGAAYLYDAAQAKTRMAVSTGGTLTLTPDAGANALVANSGPVQLRGNVGAASYVKADRSLTFYDLGAENWAAMGCDVSGQVWLRVGLSDAARGLALFGTQGTLTLAPAAGQAALVAQGNVGLYPGTPGAWNGQFRALQFGAGSAVWGHTTASGMQISDNTLYDTSPAHKALYAGQSSKINVASGVISFDTAPSVGAGATQTFTPRMLLSNTGTLTLTPEAGVDALLVGTRFKVNPKGPGGPVPLGDGVEKYALDCSNEGPQTGEMSIANNTFAYIWSSAVAGTFSGLFVLNDTNNGFISCWLTGGSFIYKLGGHESHVGGVVPAAGQTGIYFGGGGYGLGIHNATGTTHGYRVMAFRTRPNQ